MTRRALRALLQKELRELLPLWAVTMAALLVAGVTDALTPGMFFFAPIAMLGILAPVALGAMSMGHEFRHGTLASYLSLPVSRRSLLVAKAVVLGTLLLLLAGAAWWAGARTPRVLMPLALGFVLAPWLTLLTRSELAGTVLTCAVPSFLLFVGHVAGAGIAGIGTGVVTAIAAVDVVRRFLVLQVIDRSDDVYSRRPLPRAGVAAEPRRPPGVYGALLRKELRLQTLPIVLACVVSLIWWVLPLVSAASGEDSTIASTRDVLLPLLAVLLALLTGALASADERHLGVWAHQLLMPVPLWKQWAVKVTVVLGLSFVFALAIVDLEATRWRFGYWVNLSVSLPVFAAGAAALSLYVSSLSRRGVVALLVSTAAAFLWLGLAGVFVGVSWRWTFVAAWATFYEAVRPGMLTDQTASVVSMAAARICVMLPVLVLVWFAMTNHRRLDHPAKLVWSQVAAIVLVTLVSVGAYPVAGAFQSAVFERNLKSNLTQSTR